MWPNPQVSAYLVTFTEEVLNWKLHFLSSVSAFEETEIIKQAKVWDYFGLLVQWLKE